MHKPAIITLTENKLNQIDPKNNKKLKYTELHNFPFEGFSGGLLLLWTNSFS